ncbi:MAG TPA: alginate export family protein, partial [Dissulfurispiraceae bacterium]|nr:alginate export family protein [Dissulfurispiraceae bacterium]
MTAGKLAKVFLLLLSAVLFVPPAFADETATDIKFSYGASLRLRQEIWDNVVDLNTAQKDRNFFRLRASVWGKLDAGQNWDLYSRITTEPKYYGGPFHNAIIEGGQTKASHNQYLDPDEVIFDNLYASGKKLLNGKIDIRVGRQDFLSPSDIYGEGFLLMDGTPGDGSRTFYFNAAKLRFNITPDNSIDFVYIADSKTDVFLPSIHPAVSGNVLYVDNKKLLTTSDEHAFMIYSRNKIGQNFTFDPYYIRKQEAGFTFPVGTIVNPNLILNTIGGRATFQSEGWRAKAEIARQFGHYEGTPSDMTGNQRTGLGGYAFGGYKFEKTLYKPEFDLGVVYLSGDNPNKTDRRTAWDPLFSRNPYWNELYIYTLVNETARRYAGPIPGYWTNMVIYMIKGKVNFTDKTSLTMTYQYLTAPDSTSNATVINSANEFSNTGKVRGSLPTAILNHTFNKYLDGMLQAEFFS